MHSRAGDRYFWAAVAAFFLLIAPVEAEERRIRHILIQRKNIFATDSPMDQRFPYSWANKLHIVTRESYIRSALLFREGDALDLETLREAERHLRSRPIFRYVKITPVESESGDVDVLVETEDVWTTAVNLSYSVAGGKSSYAAGIHEQNFLGTGKVVGAFIKREIDRTTRGVSFLNPQLLGSRWQLFGGYGRDDKGREWETYVERPYYSSRTRHSEGASFENRENEDRLFENGQEVAHFDHDTRRSRVFASYALVAKSNRVRRVSIAHERIHDEFANAQGIGAPRLPANRSLTPLLVGVDWQNLRYHKLRGVITFDRDEDVNLGMNVWVEGGPSYERWGATRDGWIGRTTAMKNFHFKEKHVWFNALVSDGRMEQGVIRDGIVRLRSQYFITDWRPLNTASLRAECITSKNLDPEEEFLLGGENGLRGYSVRQFSGPNRALFSLENRRTLAFDWLHLVSVGWAAFADTGAVWEEKHRAPPMNAFRSNLGLGLRLAPSRSVNPGIVRIDVAYALQENERSSKFVLNIGADLSFGEKRARKFDQ